MQNSSLSCTGKSKPWSSRFQTPVEQLPGEWYSSLIFQVPTYQQQPQHSFPLPLPQLLMQALWTFSALSSGWPEDTALQPVIVGSFTAWKTIRPPITCPFLQRIEQASDLWGEKLVFPCESLAASTFSCSTPTVAYLLMTQWLTTVSLTSGLLSAARVLFSTAITETLDLAPFALFPSWILSRPQGEIAVSSNAVCLSHNWQKTALIF